MANHRIDMTGLVFGKWTVLSFDKGIKNRSFWNCRCECGNTRSIRGDSLRDGGSVQCTSCFAIRKWTRHGLTYTPEFNAWRSIIDRCTNQNCPQYINYGGRGIKICDRWFSSVVNFCEDMGKRPSKDYSIDRIDVNGNYEPSNCRWATKSQQGKNRRCSKKTQSLIDRVTTSSNNRWEVTHRFKRQEQAEEFAIKVKELYDKIKEN